jgi:hypothetical protein
MSNRIILIGDGQHKENLAAATITPGNLIELTSANTVQKHSTEGGYAEAFFAEEDALQGNTISDNYSAGDRVMGYLANKSDNIYAFIQAGQTIVIGDKLISGGDDTLIKNGNEGTGTTVYEIVAVALEAVDLSATGAVATRIPVRVL